MAQEYSIHVWADGKIQMERCIAHTDIINSVEIAAYWGYKAAVYEGRINDGDRADVDVSVDASDDWTTVQFPR